MTEGFKMADQHYQQHSKTGHDEGQRRKADFEFFIVQSTIHDLPPKLHSIVYFIILFII